MQLFQNSNGKLEEIKEVKFSSEREMQHLCEENVEMIFGCEFVSSEFTVGQFRIDTLAFDKERNSFVIIEYKNGKSGSVVDQGYSYLSTMLNNKADFVLEYLEKTEQPIKRDDIDWSQSRIIFVAPIFTAHQKNSVNFKDLPFELVEVRKFNNGNIAFDSIKASKTAASIKTVSSNNEEVKKVNEEVKTYTEEEHLNGASDLAKELYTELKKVVQDSNEFEVKALKKNLEFTYKDKNTLSVIIQKNALKLYINAKAGEIEDPKGITEDHSQRGHYGTGDYCIKVEDTSEYEYIANYLLPQCINKA